MTTTRGAPKSAATHAAVIAPEQERPSRRRTRRTSTRPTGSRPAPSRSGRVKARTNRHQRRRDGHDQRPADYLRPPGRRQRHAGSLV